MKNFSHSAILAITLVAFLLTASCSRDNDTEQFQDCMTFLYKYMSPEDDLLYPRDFWERNVRKTLEVKEKMGWDIPDREFMYFVLPLRANNENLDDFRTTYADTLCRRVAGMSMTDAALELNHWCREQVTYDSSVRSGDSPMEIIRIGSGACIELSEILVVALRAAGIPARQVNVLWTHVSGAHSWVEAWVDGGWHYMGGTEPSLKLDFSWFRNRATQVMLARIPVFGDYDGPETILSKTEYGTEISNLARYAPEKELTVIVKDKEGKPKPGVTVWFFVGKGHDKMVLHTSITGQDGEVKLMTGFGDCTVLASNGKLFGVVKSGAQDTCTELILQMTQMEAYEASSNMVLTPPVESIVPGTPDDWDDWKDAEEARVAYDDSIRLAARKKMK